MDSDSSGVLAKLRRTTEQFHSLPELERKLASGKPLRVKYGVDATAPFLHIGHAVNLWMMRALQEAGHTVVFLLGDFTTRIGDPTGKSHTRPVLSDAEIDRNAEAFLAQVGHVLMMDPAVFEVRRNSEWFSAMSIADFLGLLSSVTHGHLISRDMFRQRIASDVPIYMHEMLYPILQGYDSVMIESDLTIVGTDQLFNEMMGRFFQERAGQEQQVIITTKITPGTDGKEKQSKSLGNYIALADTPRDKFGKVMSIPDDLIRSYFEVYTDEPLEAIQQFAAKDPMGAKKQLATALVRRYHGGPVAQSEREWFDNTFSRRLTPEDIPVVRVPLDETLVNIAKRIRPDDSKAKLRGIIANGGFRVDGSPVLEPESVPTWDRATIRIGKLTWAIVERNL